MKYQDTELAAGGLQQTILLYTTTVLKASSHEGYLPALIISHESLSITQQSHINQLVMYIDTVIYLNARRLKTTPPPQNNIHLPKENIFIQM